MNKLIAILSLGVFGVSAFAQTSPDYSAITTVSSQYTVTTGAQASANHTEKFGLRPVNYKSLDVNVSSTSIGVLYLRDGLGNGFTALEVPLFTVQGLLDDKLNIVALGAIGLSGSSKVYMGTGLSYLLYSNNSGLSVTLFGGYKGFDISNGFRVQSGQSGLVYGIGINIPVKGL